MGIKTISPKLLIFILLLVFCAISLIIRIAIPYDNVFSGEWIKFTTNDAYYQMRIVDYLVYNFPNLTQWDPYLAYPDGGGPGNLHFFNLFLATVIWIISLGKYNQHLIDLVGVYLPPILAALSVIPVYFIGKELFNKWAGVLAAALMAVLPGEFLVRSILGSTDQHVAEILFSTVSVLFFILATKEAEKQQLGFGQFTKEKWKLWLKPLIYSCLGGLFFAMYLVTWQGALLFILIISIYIVFQFIINHIQHQSSSYLGITGFVYFLVAAIIFLPSVITNEIRLVIFTALLLPLALTGLSTLVTRIRLNRGFYPLTLIVVVALFLAYFYFTESHSFNVLINQFSTMFFPQGYTASTTSEMQPFLSVTGTFSTQVAWENFTTSFFLFKSWPIPGLGIISLVILIWLFIRDRGRQKLHLFLIVWTLVMLIATLIQRRFAYYLTINIALISGYFAWQILWLGGLRNLISKISSKTENIKVKIAREKRRKKRKESQGITVYYFRVAIAAVVVFVLFFLFNILMSKQEASVTPLAPSDAWQEGLTWLKENSPEPLGSDEAYFTYQTSEFAFPASAYSVASWWDYGYWISRTARRIPIINPSQNPERVAQVAGIFVSPDEKSANVTSKSLNARYIICDTAMATTKFWGIITWTGQTKEDFFEDYYIYQNGKMMEVTVFYPEYYKSMLIRLYNFDGKAVTATEPTVITFVEKVGQDGKPFKQITGAQQLSTYEEAIAFIDESGPANHRLVSMNPFASPIPLESIEIYRLVFSSKATNTTLVKGVSIPQVKIYEYAGN